MTLRLTQSPLQPTHLPAQEPLRDDDPVRGVGDVKGMVVRHRGCAVLVTEATELAIRHAIRVLTLRAVCA